MEKICNKIIAEATDNSNERYHKLWGAIGYLYAKNNNIVSMIKSIEDEKGYLIINWIIKPSPSLIKDCQDVWASTLCCENPDNIEHYFNGKKFEI